MSPVIVITILIIIGIIIASIVIKNVFFSSKLEKISRLMDSGNYQSAIKDLKFIINKNASDAKAHYLLGECYFSIQNFEWAMPEFKQVLKLNKFGHNLSEHSVRSRLAQIYLNYGKAEEAQKEFLLMTKLQPNNFMNYYNIGRIFRERGYLDNAYKYITKAIDINPKHADSLFTAGEISYQQGRLSDCSFEMTQLLKEKPEYLKAHYYLGMVQFNSKNYAQAIKEFELSSRDPDFRLTSLAQKGRALFENRNIENAIIELERAKRLIKKEDSVALAIRYYLSLCYESKRQLDKAIELWEEIHKINANYQDVPEKLATYEELRSDDKIKDILTASDADFLVMCKLIIKFFGFNILDLEAKKGNVVNIVATEAESKWRNTRKIKRFIRFVRTNDIIGDTGVREVMDLMKETGASKSMLVISNKFSRQAMDYATTRPIDLIDKKGLSKLLKRIEGVSLDDDQNGEEIEGE